MPKIRRGENYAMDTTSFTQAIENYVAGRVTLDNPTMIDYLDHYGSKKALASHYADVNDLKYDTARKQIERMMGNPNMRLKPETVARLGKLQANEGNVVITIKGWFTYDAGSGRWEYNTFSNVRNPFSADEMRDIIKATRSEEGEKGNQAGIDKFMQLYGVDGLSPTFARQDLSISISSR